MLVQLKQQLSVNNRWRRPTDKPRATWLVSAVAWSTAYSGVITCTSREWTIRWRPRLSHDKAFELAYAEDDSCRLNEVLPVWQGWSHQRLLRQTTEAALLQRRSNVLFSHTVVNTGNNLTGDTVSSPSINSFKHKLTVIEEHSGEVLLGLLSATFWLCYIDCAFRWVQPHLANQRSAQ